MSGIALHLRGEVRGVFFDFLEQQRPDLLPRYKQLYTRGAYAPVQERRRLARLVGGPDLPPEERMRGRLEQPKEVRKAPVATLSQQRLF